MGKKLLVFFIAILLVACSKTGQIQFTDEMNDAITNYIIEYNKNRFGPTDEQFEVHKIYGAEEKEGTLYVYLYSLFEGFNKETGDRVQSGASLPMLVKMKKNGFNYDVFEIVEPRDGEEYASSIYGMFPKEIAKKAITDTSNAAGLQDKMNKKVSQWLAQTR